MSQTTTYTENQPADTTDANITAMQIVYTTDDDVTHIVNIANPTKQVKLNVQRGSTEENESLIRTTLEVYSYDLDFSKAHGDARVKTDNFKMLMSLKVDAKPLNIADSEHKEEDADE